MLLQHVQHIIDLHCLTFYCVALNYVALCCHVVEFLALEGESGCASYASHCGFVDGMFRNAALCTRGTERFMVCCEPGHDYVPLN